MADEETQGVAWWLRWITRGVGICGGISVGVGGIFTFVSHIISPICIVAASFMMVLAFLLFVFEATICCGSISFAQPIVTRIDKVKFWHKAAVYCS